MHLRLEQQTSCINQHLLRHVWSDAATHMCRLAELGFTKLFNEIDMKEAARQGLLGLGSKPLDTEHIQAFLEDFGLDAEFGVHSRIRGLSGVQTQLLSPSLIS